ncbi:MAG: four helix bundle protein [Candidatus Levybacteria bacterium]|nr:four helix bundle protein [Candidatus Levybacteria bacterium]
MIKNLEDLQVWQKARILSQKIYKITASFPVSEKNILISQLRRASNSVCANIAEGFERYHFQESIQFYRTARGSLSEIKSHLYLALDQGYLSKAELEAIFLVMDEIGKMLNSLITKTKTYRANTRL